MVESLTRLERGEISKALAAMDECIRDGEMGGFVYPLVGIRANMSLIYGELGAFDRAFELARAALAYAEQALPPYRPEALGALAYLYLQAGDVEQAEATIAQASEMPALMDFAAFGPTLLAEAQGQLMMRKREYDDAIRLADLAREALKRGNNRAYLPYALHLKGKALLEKGELDAAYQELTRARAECDAMDSRHPLWPILFDLCRLETQRGNPAQAEALRAEAQSVVEFIAEHIDDPSLRDSFLRTPPVRAVLDSQLEAQ
jgi:tetratricopeptide (TPR) repeat protein